MKTAQFRLQPRIQPAFQNPAVMGIRAVAFAVAAIALVRRGAIGGNFALEIRLFARQVMTGRTLPHVELLFVGEAGVAEMFRAVMRMARDEFQDHRNADQQQRVAAGQDHFDVDAVNHSPPNFWFSWISLNSTPSGFSRGGCFFMCLRQASKGKAPAKFHPE